MTHQIMTVEALCVFLKLSDAELNEMVGCQKEGNHQLPPEIVTRIVVAIQHAARVFSIALSKVFFHNAMTSIAPLFPLNN